MKNNVENLFWRKKEFCYFVLSLMVIAMHTLGTSFYSNQLVVGDIHQYTIDVFRIYFNSGAVPLFFIISAVLFFRNVNKFSDAKKKTLSHIKNLVIPFIIWNLIGILFNLIIFNIPFISQYIEVRDGVTLSFKNIIEGIFFYKYNLLFWYVAQLLVFTLIAPLINCILKSKKLAFVVLFLVLGLYIFQIDIPGVIFRRDALIYYLIGAIIGKYYFSQFKQEFTKKQCYIGLIIMALTVIINSLLPGKIEELVWPIMNTIIAFSIWISIGIFKNYYQNKTVKFIECSFFVYACHYYIEPCISKLLLILLPISIPMMYFNNIITFFVTAISVYMLASGVRKYVPKVYNMLTGMR